MRWNGVIYGALIGIFCSSQVMAQETPAPQIPPLPRIERPNPMVLMKTSKGDVKIELFGDKAPYTVKNFLDYVKSKQYDGTIFHRVIKNFMIQGGGFTADMNKKPTRDPVVNEANNGLRNTRGTIAMARLGEPHSATSQFFINVVDNDFLNHKSETPPGWGYCVFGEVKEGMDVVDDIRSVETGPSGPFPTDVPKETVVIESIELIDSTP